MKLSTVRSSYEDISATASENTRRLAFCGIAVVWIFRLDSSHLLGIHTLPLVLLIALGLFVFSLGADFLQYLCGTAVWAAAHSILETAKVEEEKEFRMPRWMNWPTWLLFWAKGVLCAVGYLLLCGYIVSRVVADILPAASK